MIIPPCFAFENVIKNTDLDNDENVRQDCFNCLISVLKRRYIDDFETNCFLSKFTILNP